MIDKSVKNLLVQIRIFCVNKSHYTYSLYMVHIR